MTRFTIANLYVGVVVLMILALQGSSLPGWSWFAQVFVLPAISVGLLAFAARRRMARGPQDVAPWETRPKRPAEKDGAP